MPRATPCASASHPPSATRQVSPLFQAITARQCTRSDNDGKPLSAAELTLLEQACSSTGVRLLLLTELPVIERVLEQVVQANPAFVWELKAWFRFNVGRGDAHARRPLQRDIGQPGYPDLAGSSPPQSENEKYARQIRSSAGIAVFIGQAAANADWLAVGRCYERFALQATTLGIRNAFLSQPVEVSDLRLKFVASLGLGGQRPDLVVLFGRGPRLPSLLRRPVRAVLV